MSSKLSESQRSAFRFLRARAADGDAFTQADIEKEVGWKTGSFSTYKTKHLKGYIERVGKGSFTISPHFRRLTEDDFHSIVTQSRNTIARFVRTVFDAVLRYEFLLPLTNERKLRTALDELFFKDQIELRAREIGLDTLKTIIPAQPGEKDDPYVERVVIKVGSLLGGYSIGHVHGRFRAGGLRTHVEAAKVVAERGRYLVDETTAVVRFILPLGGSRKEHGAKFDVTKEMFALDTSYAEEIDVARRLFIAFFVESVILDIYGEDEIWFLESGPNGERLYVLERESLAAKAKAKSKASKGSTTQLGLPLMSPLEVWLRENDYSSVADDMKRIVEGWKKNNLKTRRNWWDVLAGDAKGNPREVAGVRFPIIAAIRKGQGLPPAPGALKKSGEKPLPPKD